MPITPLTRFDYWWAKREDLANWTSPMYPSGAKVRQFLAMIDKQRAKNLVIGCSRHSLQQVYCAAVAHMRGLTAHIFVPQSKVLSDVTKYCIMMGATMHYVKPPAWPSIYRKEARDFAKRTPNAVRWDRMLAFTDTMEQVSSVPSEARRVLLAVGSGLTASSILAGLATCDMNIPVVGYQYSTMAERELIIADAKSLTSPARRLPKFTLIQGPGRYDDMETVALPDGTPMDPVYSAKLFKYIQPGDVVWLTGLRPVCCMGQTQRDGFSNWHGPAKETHGA
jgi:1-aminocyclopropane-1-carboxylate deaminase/D-cysteine desulfhydrase-like pyridoxal-dependent ACC family enzyme